MESICIKEKPKLRIAASLQNLDLNINRAEGELSSDLLYHSQCSSSPSSATAISPPRALKTHLKAETDGEPEAESLGTEE